MPSNHPIPTIAALALSLYTSDRRLENLPRVTEYQPHEIVSLAAPANVSLTWYALAATRFAGEGI